MSLFSMGLPDCREFPPRAICCPYPCVSGSRIAGPSSRARPAAADDGTSVVTCYANRILLYWLHFSALPRPFGNRLRMRPRLPRTMGLERRYLVHLSDI